MTPAEEKALAAQMRREVRPLQWVPSVEEGWHVVPPGQSRYWAAILPEETAAGTWRAKWEILVDGDTGGIDVLASGVCDWLSEAKQVAEVEIRKWLFKARP